MLMPFSSVIFAMPVVVQVGSLMTTYAPSADATVTMDSTMHTTMAIASTRLKILFIIFLLSKI